MYKISERGKRLIEALLYAVIISNGTLICGITKKIVKKIHNSFIFKILHFSEVSHSVVFSIIYLLNFLMAQY